MDLAPPPADSAPVLPPPVGEPEPPAPILGGVAALLAERLDVDAVWIRIAFVVLSLVGGIGVLLYGALWLALIVGARPGRRWARLAGGALLILGLPLLLTDGLPFFDGSVAVLALLVGLAVALWQPRSAPRSALGTAAPTTSGEASPLTSPDGAGTIVDEAAPAHVTGRRLRMPRRTPRPPSILGRLALGLAVLVAAVGALIDQANGARLHPEQWLGLAAIVCGIGLVVGAVAGHARWLAVPALAFAGTGFVAGEAARIGVEPTSVIGDASLYVGSGDPGGWHEREHIALGTVDIYVDGAPLEPVTVDARVAIGEIELRAADDVTVEVRARVDHGDVEIEGVERGDGTYTVGPEGPPDVIVDARVGRGQVDVDQYAPPREPPMIVPTELGRLTYVAEGVALARNGTLVLADGEAVIDGSGSVLSGASTRRGRATVLTTSIGEFQLLAGGLLLTPYGELLDLQALRADLVPPIPIPGG